MASLWAASWCEITTVISNKVSGILLLDSAEEQHVYERLDELTKLQATASLVSQLARFGVVRLLLLFAPEKVGVPANTSPKKRKKLIADFGRSSFFKASVYEMEAYFSAPEKMRKAAGFGQLGTTPLTVVTHGKPLTGSQAFLEAGWNESQQRLATLSTNSQLVIAEDSGHAISLDEPEMVVSLVQQLIARSRRSTDQHLR